MSTLTFLSLYFVSVRRTLLAPVNSVVVIQDHHKTEWHFYHCSVGVRDVAPPPHSASYNPHGSDKHNSQEHLSSITLNGRAGADAVSASVDAVSASWGPRSHNKTSYVNMKAPSPGDPPPNPWGTVNTMDYGSPLHSLSIRFQSQRLLRHSTLRSSACRPSQTPPRWPVTLAVEIHFLDIICGSPCHKFLGSTPVPECLGMQTVMWGFMGCYYHATYTRCNKGGFNL